MATEDSTAFFKTLLADFHGETVPQTDGQTEENRSGTSVVYPGRTSADAVRGYCEEHGVSPQSYYTYAFGLALEAYTNTEEVFFTVRLKDGTVLPVRLSGKADSVPGEGIESCEQYLMEASALPEYRFENLREEYDFEGRILLSFGSGDIPAEPELEFRVNPDDSQAGCEVFYSGRYSSYTANGLAALLDHIAGEILRAETVGSMTLVSDEEECRIRGLHDTDWPVAHRPAYRLLQDAAESAGDHTAMVAVDRSLTYRELNAEANAVGHVLASAGVGPETIVAVLADRDSYAYVCRQGVLKSGGAFLPIDPDYPEDRVRFILEDSGAKIVLTSRSVKEKRPELFAAIEKDGVRIIFAEDALEEAGRDDLNVEVPDDALAYVIYTSGSTGKPKGVMLTNRNLVNFADANEKNHEILGYTQRGHVSLAIASLSFDFSIMEEFVPLANGLTVVLATKDDIMDPMRISKLMLDNGVDVMSCTPGYLSNLLDMDCFVPAAKNLRSVDFGAEAFPPSLFTKLSEINPDLYMMNGYGPTEATISCTMKVVKSADEITIGIPNGNMHVATVDREGRLQPLGAMGEMVIMGEGVGRGYIGRDDLTKKSFIRLLDMPAYRSGDLVRILENGEIEFHGRIDNQVKLRGLRVELGEIESVINSYSGVRNSIVLVIHGVTDYLGAWFTADREIDISLLKEYIGGKLTEYMVPQAFLQLAEMPLTANGKIDKKALPELTAAEEEIVPPENEVQAQILEIAKEIIGSEAVGIDTDLFAAGLSSLSAMRLCAFLSEKMGIVARVGDIFVRNTVRRLSEMSEESPATVHEMRERYPLSMTQMGIYIESERNPGTTIYNIPSLYSLDSSVDTDRMAEAIQKAAAAHPYLFMQLARTNEGMVEAVRRDDFDFKVEIICCDKLPETNELVRPFDLMSAEPLFRAQIYETPDGKYLLMDVHHIVGDGSSMEILERDIESLYQGEAVEKETYTGYEYALDEAETRKSERLEAARLFYDSIFRGIGGETLPASDGRTSDAGIGKRQLRAKSTAGAVREFCRRNKLKENAFFTYAFGLAVKSYTGSEEAIFSTIYNGRNDPRLENSVCMLVKTLPVRVEADKDRKVVSSVRDCQQYLLQAMSNDIYSFSEIRTDYGITGDLLLAYQGELEQEIMLGGKGAKYTELTLDKAMSALGVEVFLYGDEILLNGEYDPAKYGPYTMDGFMQVMDQVIQGMLTYSKVSDVTVVSSEEETRIRNLHDTDWPVAHHPAYRLLQDAAESAGNRTALVAVDRSLTYRELNGEANAVGHMLVSAGVTPETIVAVLADRDSYAYVCRQGVLKSGGAFLPIDPDYPEDRVRFILEDSGAKIALTSRSVREKRPELFAAIEKDGVRIIFAEDALAEGGREDLNVEVPDDALAYVIYTSGSTGKPKGVMLTNRNLVNFADANEKNHEILGYTQRGHVSLAIASLSFDFSIMEEFVPLTNGLTVVLATKDDIMDPMRISGLMLDNGVDVMSCTPGYLSNLLDMECFVPAARNLRSVDFGAEAFPPALFTKLSEINPDLYMMNGYGPTEATISCTMKVVKSADEITIGIPNGNMHVATVDRDGRLQPLGAMGEMVIMGEGVGRGYLGRDDLTKKCFIRLMDMPAYRSGDLVRILENGEIEFHGRIDNQVKLRGLRVELGEVESAINSYPGVSNSIVLVIHGVTDYLGAWFTADREIDISQLKEHIGGKLTEYMVPQAFMQLKEMPLTANGKIDKKALPELTAAEEEIVPPENGIQAKILEIAKEVIGSKAIGITTDLFEAGLSSITAIRFCAQLTEKVGILSRVADVFAGRTVRALEELSHRAAEPNCERELRREYPLSMTQSGIYVDSMRFTGTTIYNIPYLYRLNPQTDMIRLKKALRAAVQVHPYLSMTLEQDADGNVRAVRNDTAQPNIEVRYEKPDRTNLVRPFDLMSGDNLYRLSLFDAEGEKYLFIDFHHIVADGESFDIFFDDVSRAYRDETLKAESYSGFEFALDESEARRTERFEKARDFYTERFRGLESTVPIRDNGTKGGLISSGRLMGRTDGDRIRAFCQENKLTENAFFTTAFGMALQAYTGSEEAVFNTIYNGRNDPRVGNSVCMFVKTLPVMVQFAGDQETTAVIRSCQSYLLEAMSNDLYSYAEICSSCGLNANVIFAYQGDIEEGGEPVIGPFPAEETIDLALSKAKAGIDMNVSLEGDYVVYDYEYDPEMYGTYTMNGLTGLFDQIVSEMLLKKTVGQITLTDPKEQEAIRNLHDTDWPVAHRPAYRLLQDAAAKAQDHMALVAADRSLTYAELNAEANAVGHVLVSAGVTPETIVAVLADRDSYAYVCRQGVLKSGGAFLPIDPDYPEDRVRFILEDSGAQIVLTSRLVVEKRTELFEAIGQDNVSIILVEDAVAEGSHENLNIEVPEEALAYVIYTSGSTGKPKGVMLTNRNLVNFADANEKNHEILGYTQRGHVSLAIASLSFDFSIMEEFVPLANGLTVVLATRDDIMDPMRISKLMLDNGVDVMSCTPGYLSNLLDMDCFVPAAKNLRSVDFGAEAFPPSLFTKLSEINPDLYMMNGYGPTEATISCTMKVVKSADEITIGIPNGNMHVATVDREGRLQPLGAMGEMVIMGQGVGRGYIGRDDLTKKSFINMLDMPAYRSGDLVRILENGEIEFHGRIDNQVKLRGLRVELGEVESAINSYPGVGNSIVLVIHGATDYLGAWFTADREVNIADLKEYIGGKLTEYMVPQAFMQLKEMPLTANGKIDKKALPPLIAAEEEIVPPENEAQTKILEIAKGIIGSKAIGITTDLFEAGLSSITAIRFCAQLKEKAGILSRVADVFARRTVRALEELSQRAAEPSHTVEIRREYPLSMTQAGIFVDSIRFTGSTAYNIPFLYRLNPKTDMMRLKGALRAAVIAHPYLGVTLERGEEGEVWAVRDDKMEPYVKIRFEKPDRARLVRPFDLMSGKCLYRICLYDAGEEKYLFVDFHHIVADGESFDIFFDDVSRAYNGEKLKPESYTGFEFALDESEARRTERFAEARFFYTDRFRGLESTIPSREKGTKGGLISSGQLTGRISADRIRAFCREKQLTENAFFTTAFGMALQAYTGSEEAVFNTIYNGRSDPRLAGSVCMYVKTLPVMILTEKDQETVDVIRKCQRYLLDAMSNDLYSYAEICSSCGLNADVLFAYQGDVEGGKEPEIGPFPAEETIDLALSKAKAGIDMNVSLEGNQIVYDYEYDPVMYGPYTMNGLTGLFDQIVSEMLLKKSVGQIALASRKEQEKIRNLYDSDWPIAHRPAYRLLQDAALKAEDHTALVAVDRTMTYRELNEEANAVGHVLVSEGVTPETIVAVLADRNSYAYVMRQGVLKSGGAFLPIDPDYPEDRVRFILEDSGAKIALTSREAKAKRPELFEAIEQDGVRIVLTEDALMTGSRDNLNVEVPEEALAYVIYTSGSTGRPKGVMLTNRNLVNFVDANEKNHEILGYTRYGHVSLAIASLSFDFSIMEEFVPLANGLTVVLATKEDILDPMKISRLMLDNGVDVMSCTPGYLSNLLDMDCFVPVAKNLRSVDFGAEAFPPSLFTKLSEINPDLYMMNGYGPTEATISCTMKVVKSADEITIGIPNANMHVATVDRDGRLQPLGAMGEMVIMGMGVGRGYIGRDDLTKKCFIRMLDMPAYRSGDLVRILENGEIEFHGRIDNQVKLRGLRVELGEVESAINSYPGVGNSIVLVVHGTTDYLGAWFTAEQEVSIPDLKRHIAGRLTEYMIPQAFLQLDKMPLTANAKIDKRALPPLEEVNQRRKMRAPETELQKTLCEFYAKALDIEEIGIEDDFFELGGTSLTAAKVLMSAMVLELPIEYQDIFDARTVKNLESKILEKKGEEHQDVVNETVSRVAEAVSTAAGRDWDDDEISAILAYNVPEHADEIRYEGIGDVLLAGATGFLGIHVLRELLENGTGKVICLVRGSRIPADERIKMQLFYYFEKDYADLIGTRLFVYEGDITHSENFEILEAEKFDTVINCAASVKHFADLDFLRHVNVDGVRNLIDLCLKKKARLIQVSTTSVSGEFVGDVIPDVVFAENRLNVGQEVESNAYVYTKYMAEEAVLRAVATKGLDAKIMRVSNLMSRYTDGEFQMNFQTNSFMNDLKAYSVLGCCPFSQMTEQSDFSPIDETARSIVLLAGTPSKFTVFHVYNSHVVDLGDVLQVMEDCGIHIEGVSDAVYEQRLKEALMRDDINLDVSTLVSYRTGDEAMRQDVACVNTFTVEALYRLGFHWDITDRSYLYKVVHMIQTLGFFK